MNRGFTFHFEITLHFVKKNMINDYKIIQSHLIYFKKICYIIRNLKKKSKPFSPFSFSPELSIQTQFC